MLHTDTFNKNNKYKMEKKDYIKNTSGQYVSEDILGYFYDNICYTPFINFDNNNNNDDSNEEEEEINKKSGKKKLLKNNISINDPYLLLIENKLDLLRPSIKTSITLKDPYNILMTTDNYKYDYKNKIKNDINILQIISKKSRPYIFSENNNDELGLIEIKIIKIGILWRKSTKKKKGRSPWQEWGCILTESSIYLFKNISWIKQLLYQKRILLKKIFEPPIEEFKPDEIIKIKDIIILIDNNYNKHKNAFLLIRHGGEEEIFLSENDIELNDWINLINFISTYKSTNINIKDNNDDDSNDDIRRKEQINIKIKEKDEKIIEQTKLIDDMINNIRHLLILSPIQSKTRDSIIYSAARMDAQLKWLRRELWRIKCFRNILFLDYEEELLSSTPTNIINNNNNDDKRKKSITTDNDIKRNRRSLHKSLRDVNHKKSKESTSTIKSDNDKIIIQQDDNISSNREKEKYIYNGKQASIIKFGDNIKRQSSLDVINDDIYPDGSNSDLVQIGQTDIINNDNERRLSMPDGLINLDGNCSSSSSSSSIINVEVQHNDKGKEKIGTDELKMLSE